MKITVSYRYCHEHAAWIESGAQVGHSADTGQSQAWIQALSKANIHPAGAVADSWPWPLTSM